VRHYLEGRVARYTYSFNNKAEYMAAVEASKEALWLRGLVETFSIMQDSVRVHCDS